MCFRPPTAQKPVKCSACGTTNPAAAKSCIKCKAELTSVKAEAEKPEENKKPDY